MEKCDHCGCYCEFTQNNPDDGCLCDVMACLACEDGCWAAAD